MKPLRARPALARRYLALEGRRVLAESPGGFPGGRAAVDDPVPRPADGIARDGQRTRKSPIRRNGSAPSAVTAPDKGSRARDEATDCRLGWSSRISRPPRTAATATRTRERARSSSCSRPR